VALPIDQIRPKLSRLREFWTLRATLGAAAGAASLLLVLFIFGFLMNPQYGLQLPKQGLYVQFPKTAMQECPGLESTHLILIFVIHDEDTIPNPILPRPRRTEIYFDEQKVGNEGLGPHLQRALNTGPVPFVYVLGPRDANVEEVYRVIDALKGIDQNLAVVLVTPSMERPCLSFHEANEPFHRRNEKGLTRVRP
jgi:hypothetical protein